MSTTISKLEAISAELRETAAKLRAGELTVDQSECARIFDDIANEFDAIQLVAAENPQFYVGPQNLSQP